MYNSPLSGIHFVFYQSIEQILILLYKYAYVIQCISIKFTYVMVFKGTVSLGNKLFLNSTHLLDITSCANNNCSKVFILKKSKTDMLVFILIWRTSSEFLHSSHLVAPFSNISQFLFVFFIKWLHFHHLTNCFLI